MKLAMIQRPRRLTPPPLEQMIVVMNTRRGLSKLSLFGNGFPCSYCGFPAESDDHTPPRCLLQKPYPKNLATIPACHKCNERFSEDEEVVEAVLAHVSFEEDLMRERRGGKVARAIDRNPKLKASTEGQTDENGRFRVTKKTLGKVSRVAEKTVQGLYFRRYERMLAPQDVTVLAIEHQHQVSVDQMIKQFCGPESWPDVTRDGKALERAALAHLGDIKVDWEDYQPGVFRFAFFKGRRSRLVCLLDLHQTLVVAVECPRPPSR